MEMQYILHESIKYIPTLTALVAVVVGPIVSLKVVKKQIDNSLKLSEMQINNSLKLSQDQQNTARENANLQSKTVVLSKNRQDWINELRREISEFIVHAHSMKYGVSPIQSQSEAFSKIAQTMDKFYLSYIKINLLINPSESDHIDLIRLLKKIHSGITQKDFDIMAAQSELIEISQTVLKREWERVKKIV